MSLLLASCTTVPLENTSENLSGDGAESVSSGQTDTTDDGSPPSGLTAELLYDVLLANVAAQRGEYPLALEALTRASYSSRDRRLINDAIQLATRIKDYPKAIELSQLFNQIDPDNYRVLLSLANAQASNEEYTASLDILVELASQQSLDKEHILQEIAILLFRQKNPDLTQGFYSRAEAEPDNPQLSFTAALLASRLQDTDKIIGFIEQALAQEPAWETAAMLKATQLSTKSLENIQEYAEDFLEKHPDLNRFRLHYGRLLIQHQKLDEALAVLQNVLEYDPQSPDALFTSGLIYQDKEQFSRARESFESFLFINPQHDQARIYLSDIESAEKNYRKAAQYLRQVSDPQHYLDAQVKLSRVLIELKNLEAGIEHLQQIDIHNEEERARIILEQDLLFREHDMLDRSKQVLDEGLAQLPDQPDLLYNRGLLAAQLDLLELHEQDMRKLIGIQPENAHAYNALGYTLADKTDRLEEAMALITKANDLLPDNAFILDSMGWVHFRQGNNEIAIEFLRRAMELRPDPEIAAHLGEVLWVMGNKSEAEEIWSKGMEWSTDNPVLLETIKRFTQQEQSSVSIPSRFSQHL